MQPHRVITEPRSEPIFATKVIVALTLLGHAMATERNTGPPGEYWRQHVTHFSSAVLASRDTALSYASSHQGHILEFRALQIDNERRETLALESL